MQIPEGTFKAYDVRGIYKTPEAPEAQATSHDGTAPNAQPVLDATLPIKGYDIRAVYADVPTADLGPNEINDELIAATTKAFITHFDIDTVIMGHDMRNSSPRLVEVAQKAATEVGANVILIGLVGTDVTNWASGAWNHHAMMFTASHNPGEWNGIKFARPGAEPVGKETGLVEIEELVQSEKFRVAETPGTIEERDAMAGYKEHMLSFVDVSKWKPLKVVVDAGNGMAGKIVPYVWDVIPGEMIPMYFELDGSFPNHAPSPIEPENVADLIERVKEEGADVGLAFDGDADRVFFIDETGGRIPASLTVAMVAKSLLEKNPGATMIYNAVTSKVVPEVIEAGGGTPLIERVGHSYLKARMKETGALFAGEHSGHYFFKDNYNADSGLLAALIVLEMLATSDKPFSEWIAEFQKYYAIEETNSEVADKNAILEKLKAKYTDAKMTEFDGVTFEYDDYWFNVRPSNTEPVLRLNLEANTPKLRDEKAKEVLAVIRE